MSVIKYIGVFAVGAALGAVGGYFFAKNRYEKEIADFKAEYKQRSQKLAENAKEIAKHNEEMKEKIFKRNEEARAQAKAEAEEAKTEEVKEKTERQEIDMARYKEHIQNSKYSNDKAVRPIRREGEPYVIDQDEYEDPDYDEYEKDVEFEVYEDGVVVDEAGSVMDEDEIEDTVGNRWKYFFEDNPKEDACFVRNEEKQIDYVVVKVGRDYYEKGE
jgi:gas vesicle protein